jgi:protein-S-isoprenylcysteine O-methyltransferase Ste14
MFHGAEIYSIVFWGAIVCFVLIGSYFKFKTRESEHRMLERLAEKGQAISPDLLANIGRDDGHRGGSITGALVLMFIGIGVAFMLWSMTGAGGFFQGDAGTPNWLPTVGLIPFLIGVALLIGRLFERRSPK